ncbi:MAG: hypothetical protein ACRCTY_01295, partial [Candidatus Adiutrix sp.]
MKVVLIQQRVRFDRPSDNLAALKAALEHEKVGKCDLAVFPRLALSGRLSLSVLSRPNIDLQYDKVWADFLAISTQHPQLAIASSSFHFSKNLPPFEQCFVVQNGQLIYNQTVSPENSNGPLILAAPLKLGQTSLRVLVAPVPPLPQDHLPTDVLITLGDQKFSGQPLVVPNLKTKGPWRLNVSQVGLSGND